MDYSTLRGSDGRALSHYFRAQIAQHGTSRLTESLLSAIEAEALPPTLWYTWLSASGDCQAIFAGLDQPFSQYVRRASITKFSKIFRSTRLEEVWDAIGGTPGVIRFLSHASVFDVKHFCRAIGTTTGSKALKDLRQQYVDELHDALCQQDIQVSGGRSLDQRPLLDYYRDLLPACSAIPTLRRLQTRKADAPIDDISRKAITAQCRYFRDRCLATLEDASIEVDVKLLTLLLSLKSNEVAHYNGEQVPTDVIFVIRVLQALSRRKIPRSTLNSNTTHSILASPLFKRLRWRKTSTNFVKEAITAYSAYSTRHPETEQHVNLQQNMVVEFIARKWSRHDDELQSCLIEVFALVSKTQVITVDQIEALLAMVPRSKRFQLLAFAMQYMPPLQLDINLDADLRAVPWTWSVRLFQTLARKEARTLFARLIKVKPDPFGPPITQIDQIHRDPAYFLLTLADDDNDKVQMCAEAVEQRKMQASKARKQPERCFWVQYALRCAVESGSLALYRETLHWAKRFTRDPLTAAAIYGGEHMCHTDVISLLSCLTAGHRSRSIKAVRDSVEAANLICQELVETACEAQLELSFARHSWQGALDLMSAVVFRRLEQVNDWQDTLQVSDEGVYDAVWSGTLEVSLRLETIGLNESNVKLDCNTLSGPIWSPLAWEARPKVEHPRPATLLFLDSLARSRDELWRAYRQSRRPDTVTLPAGFPRGLPCDCLLPVSIVDCIGADHLSFLQARAKNVVFSDPAFALAAPTVDNETISNIGPFVEDYPTALFNYVSWSANRLEAANRAWQHAIGPLSISRMSEPEAFIFWSTIFSKHLESLKLDGPWSNDLPYPAMIELPSNEAMDECEPLEWNPDPSPRAWDVKNRRLDPTILDIMLDRPFDARDTAESSLTWEVEARVPGRTRPSYFIRNINKQHTVSTKDTIIATALMYIGARNGQSPGILAAPFPSELNIRYPALYLDGDFLEQDGLRTYSAFRTLRRVSDLLPPTLLLDLSKGITSAADEKATRRTQDAIEALRILIRCDKPQVALQVVTQVILERPDDSSSHRALLIPSLFKSLSPDKARALLFGLSIGIQEKLVKQAQHSDSMSASPVIKVTTVKMLAQLLSGATFIDQASACQILIPILEVSKHIDIICAVISSLLDTLANASESTVEEIVLDALQQYAVPIMSSMDERRPISQDAWSEFEIMSADVPEVYMEGDAAELPPVWEVMLTALHRVEGQRRAQLFGRVLLPALRGSMQTNERWLKLFCRYIGVPEIELSYVPLKLNIVTRLFAFAVHLPPIVADLWLEVFKTTFDPPVEVLAITQHVGMDAELRNSNAGKHWLSLFDETARGLLLRGTQPASLLASEWEAEAGVLQVSQIQRLVLQQADMIIRGSGTSLHQWTVFSQALAPPRWQSTAFLLWCQYARPVLEKIAKRVDSLRTPEWQLARNRSPAVLPDTFILRLWLVCASGEKGLPTLLEGIQGRLAEAVSAKRPYADRVEQVITFVRYLGLSNADKIKIALDLGSLDGLAMNRSFDIFDHLRVDMAKQLIQGSQEPNEIALRRDTIELICSWARSFDEDIRMVGLKLRNTALASVAAQKIGLSGLWYVDPIRD